MKPNPIIIVLLTGALLALPLRAEEKGEEMKCACCAKESDKKKDLEKKFDAETAQLQKLVDEMNTTTGEKKTEVMAAVLNKLVQFHQALREKASVSAKPKPKPASEEEVKKAKDPKAENAKDPHAAHKG